MTESDASNTKTGVEHGDVWVFKCSECGKQWVDPAAPVTGHHCDRDPRAPGLPDGEPAEVTVVSSPEVSE